MEVTAGWARGSTRVHTPLLLFLDMEATSSFSLQGVLTGPGRGCPPGQWLGGETPPG